MHSKVDPADYSTLSLQGVTRLRRGNEVEFTELSQWIADYKHFSQLIQIKSFAKFRVWKAFSVWRKNVRWRSVCCSDAVLKFIQHIFMPNFGPHSEILSTLYMYM